MRALRRTVEAPLRAGSILADVDKLERLGGMTRDQALATLDQVDARRREILARIGGRAPEEMMGVEEVVLRSELAALDSGAWLPAEPVRAGAAKCGYCGRFGSLGSCEGCGAPNEPAVAARPVPPKPS